MNKLLITLGTLLLALIVGVVGAFAASGHRAQTYNAKLKPVAVGATVPTGRAHAVQNKRKFKISVHAKGLTPTATYPVHLHENVDGNGCASTSNPPLDPPAIPPIVADPDGNGSTKTKVKAATFSLDKTKSYYVDLHDAAGTSLACGDLVLKKKGKSENGHHGGGKSHGGKSH